MADQPPAAVPAPSNPPPASNAPPLPAALNSAPPAQRPEYVEERHWDAATGAVKVEDLAKSYREARTAISKGVDGYKAELLKNRPAAADAYSMAMPKEGKLAERLAKSNLVILTEKPGADFKPEAGKQYFTVNAADPLLAHWRKVAFEAGMSQEQFAEGLATYAESLAAKQPTAAQTEAAQAAEFAKLGDNGQQRAAHVWGRLQAALGAEAASALDGEITTAAGIMALEALLEKAGEPRFSAPAAGGGTQSADALRAELAKLQADYNTYWSPAVQARVGEIMKQLHPGASTGKVPGRAA